MSENELQAALPQIARGLYRKTLRSLKSGEKFYPAVSLAIKSQTKLAGNKILRKRLAEERGLIISFLGRTFIRRHTDLLMKSV